MAGVDELIMRLKQVRQDVVSALPNLALQNTITAKALIERNIREIGFGAMYSQNKLPAWFFEGKEKSGAGAAFIAGVKKKDAKAEEGTETGMTWEDLRKAEGLPTDHVNLSFTNKMWAGLGPQEPYFHDGKIYCPLGGSTQEVVNKLNWNRDRYGDFLGKVLRPREIEILAEVLFDSIDVIFKKNGF